MKHFSKASVLVLIFLSTFLLPLSTALAQTPQTINYQAIARNSSGTIMANQSVSVEIRILQGSSTGTQVCDETFATTTNDFGLINLQIGSQDPTAFAAIDWAAGPYWIEVSLNGNLFGTSQLVSVPYALHANTADSLVDFSETDPVFNASIAAGITGTDTSYWNDKIDTEVDGSVTNELQILSISNDTIYLTNGGFAKLPAGFDGNYSSLTGAPTNVSAFTNDAGYLTSFTEAQILSISNDTIYITGGSFAKLPAGFDGDYYSLTNKPDFTNWDTDVTDDFDGDWSNLSGTVPSVSTFSNDVGYLTSELWTENSGNVYRSSGNVGIGTTNPVEKLHVVGNIAADWFRGDVINDNGSSQPLRLFANGSILLGIDNNNSGTGSFVWYNNGESSSNIKMILNESGHLGIGTTTPSSTLDVNGTFQIQNGTSINEISTDGALSGNSDDAVPTEQAVKTYVDNTINTSNPTYAVGDFAHGGIVFWVDETGQHGLVCAKQDIGGVYRWYAGTDGNTQAKADGPKAGAANTTIIISAQVAIGDDGSTYAARICNELQVTEGSTKYCDWYLPSKEELALMYTNRAVIDATALANGGLSFMDQTYWSSTENLSNTAWTQYFLNGLQTDRAKNTNYYIRPVRAF